MTNLIALAPGTVLAQDYRIERVLGAGGFGVTYRADDLSLSRAVTIKEYFPADFAARANGTDAVPRSAEVSGDFQWGLDRFIEEAQTLAKLHHPNIVRVYRYFRENQTGYMVLQFEEGQSFKSWLKGLGRAPRQTEIDGIVAPLLDALEFIHKADYLHRDVAPDNIIVRADGVPVLIDFGSARGDIIAHSKTVSALVKPGYSPYEQYAERSSSQGPWTDIYALGATLYHAVTGKRPPDAPSRMISDDYISAREAAQGGFRAGFLKAIDKALKLKPESRPQSIAAWRGDLMAPDPVRPGWLTFGRAAKRPPEAAADAANGDAPVQAPSTPFVPPQPDAPGPPGGLLDFKDKLAGPAAAGAASAPAGASNASPQLPAQTAGPPPPPPPPSVPSKPVTPAKAVKPAKPAKPVKPARASPADVRRVGRRPPPSLPPALAIDGPDRGVLVLERGAPQHPRPVRSAARGIGGWALPLQLMLAAGCAGAVLAYQDRLLALVWPSAPALTSKSKTTTTSSSSATATTNADTPVLAREIAAHSGDAVGLALTDDGRTAISVGRDATLKVWSLPGGSLVRTIPLDNRLTSAFAVSGRRAVTGQRDGTVALYDIDKGERLGVYKRNDAEVWSLAFLGSVDRFAAAGHDYKTAIWRAGSPSVPELVLDGHSNSVQAVAYTAAEGPWIATGGADKTVRLYEADTGDIARVYKGLSDFVTVLAFAPDGKTFAAASLDGEVRLYGTGSTRSRAQLEGHRGRVNAIAFAPNGDQIATAGEDGTVRVWTVGLRRQRILRMPTVHNGGAYAVAFTPDGRQLASSGADGAIRLWTLPARKSSDD